MRRRLLLVVLAASALVVVAFAIPLGVVVERVAEDRALAAAERDAAALAPVLAVTEDVDTLRGAVERTSTGDDDRLTVWLPDGTVLGSHGEGHENGEDGENREDETDDDLGPLVQAAVDLARIEQRTFSQTGADDLEIYTPVVLGDGGVAVIRAEVPDSLRRSGVTTAWLALAGVAAALLVGAGVVADRLGRSLTRDATGLADTARALAGGDASARAHGSDTVELADAGRALNLLADRIDELRTAERERVADLSHRLRTPLTVLRLDAEASGSPALVADVDRMEAAVSDLVRTARRPLHDAPVTSVADLATVVRARAAFWSVLAEEDGRSWEVIAPDGPVPVACDDDTLAAGIDALLANVHGHTPAGTGYEIRLTVADGRATLSVTDDGPGIADPDAVLARGVSGGGSTGLGLDIASRAAQIAGGTLRIARPTDGGTAVVIEVPVRS